MALPFHISINAELWKVKLATINATIRNVQFARCRGRTMEFTNMRHFLAQRRNLRYDLRDEKLDRRELRDPCREHYDRARCARVLQPERVPAGGRKIFV
jgi:hypothetical protein